MIEIKDLTKKYGERTVLDVPELKINDSETVALAGANGSGKTTLLRILAGIIKKDSGTVSAPGKILYLPQKTCAFRGNLVKNITLAGADNNRAQELLEKLELSHLADKKACSLSGGELQRLALCRVLAKECGLLLLDEPTSACDAKGAGLVINAIDEYREKYGSTVIFSTHSPGLALKAAKRLIILNDGKIEADGETKTVLSEPSTEWAEKFIAGWRMT